MAPWFIRHRYQRIPDIRENSNWTIRRRISRDGRSRNLCLPLGTLQRKLRPPVPSVRNHRAEVSRHFAFGSVANHRPAQTRAPGSSKWISTAHPRCVMRPEPRRILGSGRAWRGGTVSANNGMPLSGGARATASEVYRRRGPLQRRVIQRRPRPGLLLKADRTPAPLHGAAQHARSHRLRNAPWSRSPILQGTSSAMPVN
jgi:hypothetical protein